MYYRTRATQKWMQKCWLVFRVLSRRKWFIPGIQLFKFKAIKDFRGWWSSQQWIGWDAVMSHKASGTLFDCPAWAAQIFKGHIKQKDLGRRAWEKRSIRKEEECQEGRVAKWSKWHPLGLLGSLLILRSISLLAFHYFGFKEPPRLIVGLNPLSVLSLSFPFSHLLILEKILLLKCNII